MSAITEAMIKQIERNDIVVQIAKIIAPGAFAEWFDGTGSAAKKHIPDARQRYEQAEALNKAQQILKKLARMPDLRKVASDAEAQGWRDLGVPVDNPELRKIVDDKYADKI